MKLQNNRRVVITLLMVLTLVTLVWESVAGGGSGISPVKKKIFSHTHQIVRIR